LRCKVLAGPFGTEMGQAQPCKEDKHVNELVERNGPLERHNHGGRTEKGIRANAGIRTTAGRG